MALGGGISCLKYLLFFINLLFAITGLFLIGFGAYELYETHMYINLNDASIHSSIPIVMIAIGVVVFTVAFFGCCGAIKENHCMIITFSVFLLIIFVAEIGIGIAGYLNVNKLEAPVEKYFNHIMSTYSTDDISHRTFDIIQSDFHCCGIKGPEDWIAQNPTNQTLPKVCCGGLEVTSDGVATCTMESSMLYKKGCLTFIVDHYKDVAIIAGSVAIVIAIIQLIGVIFACVLACSIRNEYETV